MFVLAQNKFPPLAALLAARVPVRKRFARFTEDGEEDGSEAAAGNSLQIFAKGNETPKARRGGS